MAIVCHPLWRQFAFRRYGAGDSASDLLRRYPPGSVRNSVVTECIAITRVSGAASADGLKLVVVGRNYIYTSTDAGTNWRLSYSNDLPWAAVASSWDGTKLVATGSQGNTPGGPVQGQIFTSVDSGTNWTQSLSPTNYWKALACSTDGTRVVAVVGGNGVDPGPIYTSPIPAPTGVSPLRL